MHRDSLSFWEESDSFLHALAFCQHNQTYHTWQFYHDAFKPSYIMRIFSEMNRFHNTTYTILYGTSEEYPTWYDTTPRNEMRGRNAWNPSRIVILLATKVMMMRNYYQKINQTNKQSTSSYCMNTASNIPLIVVEFHMMKWPEGYTNSMLAYTTTSDVESQSDHWVWRIANFDLTHPAHGMQTSTKTHTNENEITLVSSSCCWASKNTYRYVLSHREILERRRRRRSRRKWKKKERQ